MSECGVCYHAYHDGECEAEWDSPTDWGPVAVKCGCVVDCVHRWEIPTSGAKYVEGVCKVCGTQKNMLNSLDGIDGDWKSDYNKLVL